MDAIMTNVLYFILSNLFSLKVALLLGFFVLFIRMLCNPLFLDFFWEIFFPLMQFSLKSHAGENWKASFWRDSNKNRSFVFNFGFLSLNEGNCQNQSSNGAPLMTHKSFIQFEYYWIIASGEHPIHKFS